MSIVNANPEDYQNALRRLQSSSPIASKHLVGLVGQKPGGSLVLVPGSFEKGYFNSLIPPPRRPHYVTNLGIIGQLSNGVWVFPPSYDAGMREGTGDLRTAILAEGMSRLMRERQEVESSIQQITKQLEELRERETRITEELEHLKQTQA